jgi:hypothetical protein
LWRFKGFFDPASNAPCLKSLFMCGSAARDQDDAKLSTRRLEMKKFAKVALSAMLLAGAATAVASAPAQAQVSVGIGVGPGYYDYGPDYYVPRYSCDPYSRWYSPYRCGYGPAYYRGYYGPSYYYGPSIGFSFGGGWGGHRGGWDRGHGGWHGGGHHR